LKDQDESITNLPESRLFVFQSIAREVKDQLQQLLLIKKIKLDIEVTVDKAVLHIEEELLVRVILNLLDNAIKFSYVGSTIYLKFYDDDKILISVRDNGLGFEPTQNEELFKKFTK
jgi:signal transduction histidine kinase